MTMTVRQFVESLSSNGILSTGEVTSLRTGLTPEQEAADADAFVRKLVQQGKLTKFQAINLYQGRAKGLLFGDYVVLDKLGAGGMGQVFKAQHRRMKRIVALKVLPPHAVGSQKAVQRFYQEVEVAAKLTHPNIVTAYDAGESRGLHYLVMEHVEGQDLSDYLNKHGPLGVEQAINVILQAARGLAYAHSLGIIHRDIKPANLLIDAKGTVKILDMGLARIDNPMADAAAEQDELTASGEVMGTVDYMSPEQAQDTRTADHRSDIYALGCTFYRLLTGKVPYAADTTIKKILAHRDQPIPSLRASRPDIPEMLDRFYQKMLAKNVADRTPTMAQVVASLEKMLSGASEEKSSIVATVEDLVHDDSHLNALQLNAGTSNVLPGMSALGSGPGSGSGSNSAGGSQSGSKSSGILAGLPTVNAAVGGSSAGGPRALPPSMLPSGALPPGGVPPGMIPPGMAPSAPAASLVPKGAVFPSMPIGGGAPKIARAKRLNPGDTDHGGKTKGDGSPRADATHPNSHQDVDKTKRLRMLGIAGAVVALVGIGVVVFLMTRSSDDDDGEVTAAIVPQTGATGTPLKPAAAASTANSTAKPPPPPVPSASATAGGAPSLPEFPGAATPAMNFFNAPDVTVPAPTATSPPPGGAPPAPPPVNPPPASTSAPTPPGPPLTAEVDLLKLMQPESAGHQSLWKRDGTDVVCEVYSGPCPRVLVPFTPPEEYDLACSMIPQASNLHWNVGLVVAGRNVLIGFNEYQTGLEGVDGKAWQDGANPSFFGNRLYGKDEPTEVAIAVRKGRIFAAVNGRPTVDFVGDANRIASLTPDWAAAPGRLFVGGQTGTRFTKLVVGPPTLKLPALPSPVNVAAAFDKDRNAVEGEFTSGRGEILINGLPGKWSRLSFDVPRTSEYAVRCVVERRSGHDVLALGLPLPNRRTGAVVDMRVEKFIGLQHINGQSADTNATSSTPGMLLLPDAFHVLHAQVDRDPKGHRIRFNVDGREFVDYAGNDMNESTETQVPDIRAISLCTYSSGWRIVRFDVIPAGGGRLPVPSSADRSATEAVLKNRWAQADAKGAQLDAKLLAVDGLRREAAEALDRPAVRYVALEQALRIAAAAGDLPGAYEAAEDLYSTFDVERSIAQKQILDTFKPARPQAAAKDKFIGEALRYMDRAAKSGEFSLALSLAGAMEKYLGTSAADTKREVRARVTEYGLAQKLRTRAAEAAAQAEASGGDANSQAAAAAAEGLYRCLALGDWKQGLKRLADGDIAGLKTAATLELGELKTGEQMQAVADQWWTLSEAEKSPETKWALAERAALWYRRAAPLLPPKAKATLERRKTQIAQLRKASGGACGPRRPLDAVKIGDHWYKYYDAPLLWSSAERACEQLGGQLLSIDGRAENDAVAGLLLKSAGGSEQAMCWLGINDLAAEGQFRLLDGTPLMPPLYANWQPNQPDNQGGTEDAGLLYATFSNGMLSAQWVDGNAGSPYPFLCEWDR